MKRALWLTATALCLLLVGLVELLDIPNLGLLTLLVVPGELAVWLTATAVTATCAAVLLRGRWRAVAVVGALVVLVAAGAWRANWAAFSPDSYFAVHRGEFDVIASRVEAGELGNSKEYYGEKLPLWLRDLSTDGRISDVSFGEGVVFLPQVIGIPDDAGGYLYVRESARSSDWSADLYGKLVSSDRARPLGGGWFYA